MPGAKAARYFYPLFTCCAVTDSDSVCEKFSLSDWSVLSDPCSEEDSEEDSEDESG